MVGIDEKKVKKGWENTKIEDAVTDKTTKQRQKKDWPKAACIIFLDSFFVGE